MGHDHNIKDEPEVTGATNKETMTVIGVLAAVLLAVGMAFKWIIDILIPAAQ